jgi:hypothetical protein
MTNEIRQRKPLLESKNEGGEKVIDEHPGGEVKHGGPKEILRLLLLVTYFMASCCSCVTSSPERPNLTWIESLLLNFSAPLYIGITEIFTMHIWRSRNNHMVFLLRP